MGDVVAVCGKYTLLQRRQWHPTPVLLPGESYGRRSLVGCSPWGRWGLDTTEQLHFHFSLSHNGEGNGNPLQCSCLENPRDGGAWWAAVYGVTQSRTRLKRLSSTQTIQILLPRPGTSLTPYSPHTSRPAADPVSSALKVHPAVTGCYFSPSSLLLPWFRSPTSLVLLVSLACHLFLLWFISHLATAEILLKQGQVILSAFLQWPTRCCTICVSTYHSHLLAYCSPSLTAFQPCGPFLPSSNVPGIFPSQDLCAFCPSYLDCSATVILHLLQVFAGVNFQVIFSLPRATACSWHWPKGQMGPKIQPQHLTHRRHSINICWINRWMNKRTNY